MEDQNKIIDAAARFAQQQMGSTPVQQQQLVQPMPCPMSVQIGKAQGPDGKKYVLLLLHTMTGTNVFHFDPEQMDHVADALKDAARQARTGLEIPRM